MLESVLNFLNENDGAITAVATVILVVITYLYVNLTRKLVGISQETLRISDTPKVQVSLTNHRQNYNVWTVDFCVQNIGTGFAYDLKFTGDLSSIRPQTGKESLAEYHIIKNGISFLGPGKRYQIPIIWQSLKLDLPEGTFDVDVTYRDSADIKHKEQFCLDFTEYEGYTQMGDPSFDSIANSLVCIDDTLREMEKKYNNQNQ